ncbi:MAG: protein-glutamate O-methyltransferase CheR [Sphaerochaeta sp.]|nr:protein-glutamate O-methyltransferase CheR [Sphaerochaeta sp.]
MHDKLGEIVQIAASAYGSDISKYDDMFLKQVAEKRFACANVTNISEYVQYLSNNPDEVGALLRSLHITHTDFFRNPLTFAHLEQWILPSLLEGKPEASELRIWSAGCSSGQEPYSIAMLVENIHTRKSRPLHYRIIATDISGSALLQATKREYREDEIQRIRVKDLKDFFIKTGDTYKVSDRLKQHVGFSTYDLLDNRYSCPQESIFGNFDLVVCSNMLFYYKPNHQQYIVRKLIDSMDKFGYLITGEAERQVVENFTELYQVAPPSPIYKQRRGVR